MIPLPLNPSPKGREINGLPLDGRMDRGQGLHVFGDMGNTFCVSLFFYI